MADHPDYKYRPRRRKGPKRAFKRSPSNATSVGSPATSTSSGSPDTPPTSTSSTTVPVSVSSLQTPEVSPRTSPTPLDNGVESSVALTPFTTSSSESKFRLPPITTMCDLNMSQPPSYTNTRPVEHSVTSFGLLTPEMSPLEMVEDNFFQFPDPSEMDVKPAVAAFPVQSQSISPVSPVRADQPDCYNLQTKAIKTEPSTLSASMSLRTLSSFTQMNPTNNSNENTFGGLLSAALTQVSSQQQPMNQQQQHFEQNLQRPPVESAFLQQHQQLPSADMNMNAPTDNVNELSSDDMMFLSSLSDDLLGDLNCRDELDMYLNQGLNNPLAPPPPCNSSSVNSGFGNVSDSTLLSALTGDFSNCYP